MLSSPASPSTLGQRHQPPLLGYSVAARMLECSHADEAIDVQFPNANIVDVRYESFVADPEPRCEPFWTDWALSSTAVLDPPETPASSNAELLEARRGSTTNGPNDGVAMKSSSECRAKCWMNGSKKGTGHNGAKRNLALDPGSVSGPQMLRYETESSHRSS